MQNNDNKKQQTNHVLIVYIYMNTSC